jgi:hypothetical protein
MDLSGIAAILALASIPVSVLIARWQMRAMLAQSEANHRAALEAAEANHRSALELLRLQVDSERSRWMREAQHGAYTRFQSSLDRFRRSLMPDEFDAREFSDAYGEVHDSSHAVSQVGSMDVCGIAREITDRCVLIHFGITRPGRHPQEHRAERWRREVAPLCAELDEAINRENERRWA